MEASKIKGYLPNDVPPIGELILLGLQHVLTMFPATVFVALVVGFHVSTVLLASGLATTILGSATSPDCGPPVTMAKVASRTTKFSCLAR